MLRVRRDVRALLRTARDCFWPIAARGQVRAGRYSFDTSLEHVRWFADNEKLLQLTVKIANGAMPNDLTPEENFLISANFVMSIRRIENIYVQLREGLVEQEAILRFRPAAGYFDSPYFLEFWEGWQPNIEPSFREYFESEFL